MSDVVRLGKQTQAILKNFASLNSNILIKNGNSIQTITPTKNVMASAVVEETFPVEFGIWDLNKFLSVVSLFDSPEFIFGDKQVSIKDGNKSSVKYYYSEPTLLTVPTKQIQMPNTVLTIDLSHESFSELTKAASVLQVQDLRICQSEDSSDIIALVHDKNDPTSNQYSVSLGENTVDVDFNFDFNINLLRLLPGSYTVDFTETVISQFSHNDIELTYWIALESSSKYGK